MRLQAIILDWAGTTVDHGSLAPVRVMQAVFALHGISIDEAEARRNMGIAKREHLQALLQQPRIAAIWRERTGSEANQAALDTLYSEFEAMQLSCLQEYSQLIPGVREALDRFRARGRPQGLKIGSTTGYTRPMLDLLLGPAAAQGYAPDASCTPDEVYGRGRPHPDMCLAVAAQLGIADMAACVKIGDTVADMEEGRNAGMWTIGVTETGNLLGLTASEIAALHPTDRAVRRERAAKALLSAGAHFVAASVPECDAALDEIERLLMGVRP